MVLTAVADEPRLHHEDPRGSVYPLSREEQQMLLAIDVGNTNTVIGIFDGKRGVGFWRIRTVEDTDCRRIPYHFA